MPDSAARITFSNRGVRDLPIKPELEQQLRVAVTAVYGPSYRVDVMSGAQPEGPRGTPGTTGSRRHGTGDAGDVWVYDPSGKRLSGDELLPLAEHWLGADIGSVGFPVNGKNSLHLDLIGGSVPGSIPLGPKEGRVWYYGSPTKTQRAALTQSLTKGTVPNYVVAPKMALAAVTSGTPIPPRDIPSAAPIPAAMSAALQQARSGTVALPIPRPDPGQRFTAPALAPQPAALPAFRQPVAPAIMSPQMAAERMPQVASVTPAPVPSFRQAPQPAIKSDLLETLKTRAAAATNVFPDRPTVVTPNTSEPDLLETLKARASTFPARPEVVAPNGRQSASSLATEASPNVATNQSAQDALAVSQAVFGNGVAAPAPSSPQPTQQQMQAIRDVSGLPSASSLATPINGADALAATLAQRFGSAASSNNIGDPYGAVNGAPPASPTAVPLDPRSPGQSDLVNALGRSFTSVQPSEGAGSAYDGLDLAPAGDTVGHTSDSNADMETARSLLRNANRTDTAAAQPLDWASFSSGMDVPYLPQGGLYRDGTGPAGTVQLPRDVDFSAIVPELPPTPKTTRTIMQEVANPAYAAWVAKQPASTPTLQAGQAFTSTGAIINRSMADAMRAVPSNSVQMPVAPPLTTAPPKTITIPKVVTLAPDLPKSVPPPRTSFTAPELPPTAGLRQSGGYLYRSNADGTFTKVSRADGSPINSADPLTQLKTYTAPAQAGAASNPLQQFSTWLTTPLWGAKAVPAVPAAVAPPATAAAPAAAIVPALQAIAQRQAADRAAGMAEMVAGMGKSGEGNSKILGIDPSLGVRKAFDAATGRNGYIGLNGQIFPDKLTAANSFTSAPA